MRFIVSTSSLLKQLQSVSGALSSTAVLPILENFLFELNEETLIISATDLQTSMTTSLAVDSKENGKVAVSSRILLDTLKNLPEQPVTFLIDNHHFSVEISAGEGKYKMSGENGDDFPKIPTVTGGDSFNIDSEILLEGISKTLFAVSSDELRPAMTGVHFELTTDRITFVATDAHKLVRYRRRQSAPMKEGNFIVPKKGLTLLKNSLPSENTPVTISLNSTSVFFKCLNVSLICRLIDERYPDYEAVIPKQNPNKLTVERSALLNSLKRVAIFSNKTTHQVKLKISGSELSITAEDADFSNEAFERLGCLYEGADMNIGFNSRFLIEMLSNLSSKTVIVEMSTPNRAGIIAPDQGAPGEEVLMLVMPVMLNNAL